MTVVVSKVHLPRRKPVPPGIPGVDRPRLIKDEPFYKKLPIQAAMALIALGGGWLALRTYAGIYHVLTGLTSAQHDAYHRVFPLDWIRRLIIRDANEKAFAAATVQVVVYNFAAHWPRKDPGRLGRIEKRLGIANQYVDDQGFIVLILAPLWLMIYSLPGEAIVAGLLWITGHSTDHPLNWQVTAAGIVGSVIFGRRIAKGFAYHAQRKMIQERLENRTMRNALLYDQGKKPKPYRAAWWMLWPVRWRLQWVVSCQRGFIANKPWKHRRAQIAVHGLIYLAILAGVVYLTWRGGQLLKTSGI